MGGICDQGREEGSSDLSINREAHVAKGNESGASTLVPGSARLHPRPSSLKAP